MSEKNGTLIVFPAPQYEEDCQQIEKVLVKLHDAMTEASTLALRMTTRRIRNKQLPIYQPAA
jgi:hypothetical protein